MFDARWMFDPSLTQDQHNIDAGLAQVWLKCDSSVTQVWHKCDTSLTKCSHKPDTSLTKSQTNALQKSDSTLKEVGQTSDLSLTAQQQKSVEKYLVVTVLLFWKALKHFSFLFPPCLSDQSSKDFLLKSFHRIVNCQKKKFYNQRNL